MRRSSMFKGNRCLNFCICAMTVVFSSSNCTGAEKEYSTVKSESLAVHAEASADSTIMKQFKKGESVWVAYELSGMEGTWCAVEEEGKPAISGYVLCRDLERKVSTRAWRLTGSRTSETNRKSRPVEKAVPVPAKAIRPASDVKVQLYMTSWCPYCRKARELLKALEVNLIEYDIEKDETKGTEMKGKGGTGGVPFIDIEGIHIQGFGEESIKRAVAKRRSL